MANETPAAPHASAETGPAGPAGLLRFITCGSVDDGKSTLIGRLLHDSGLVPDDQAAALARDSRRFGTAGEAIDFALLVDGLDAEREQGITIDVAYRFFRTPRRRFIVADTPGHEQYTRNMATGASTADAAVVLVDARKGLLVQTRRHSYIASLLGIRHVVLAVNKIDLVGWSQERFAAIEAAYRRFAETLGFASLVAIPLSARLGDNVATRSAAMPWYAGPSLVERLEEIEPGDEAATAPFRLPVQWVNRPNADFRGFSGTLASGAVKVGAPVAAAKSGRMARVARILAPGGDVPRAAAGDAVTVTLDAEIDVSRGDMLVPPDARPHVADQFAAHIVWMDEQPLFPGRSYILRTETDTAPATVTEIRHRVDVDTFGHEAAKSLALNEIGLCNVETAHDLAFDPYAQNRFTGGFVLVDRLTNATAGAGMILHPLRRAENIHWQAVDVSKPARAAMKGQRPVALWFTGLSGSGKSTIANLLERRLAARGRHTYLLDGDNVRHGLNRDLGFTEADRVENIRRVAEVARLFVDAGLVTLVAFISPFRAERRMARERLGEGEFVEIFVDTPIELCRRRDPKGLYAKAERGELRNFTGVDSPYEAPEAPELRLETAGREPEALVDEIEAHLLAGGYI